MAGRKPIYDSKSLKIGEKLQLLGKAARYGDQYLYAIRNREPEKTFALIEENRKIFVERIS